MLNVAMPMAAYFSTPCDCPLRQRAPAAADRSRQLQRSAHSIGAKRRRPDDDTFSCRAIIRGSEAAAAVDDWSSLAAADLGDYIPEEDPDFQASINEAANKGLKAMLRDDSKSIARFKEELNVMGEFLAKEGNQQALTFCYTLLMLCDHVLCKESLKLEGIYLRAFEKLYSILEESGWKLKPEGEESSDDEDAIELPSLGSYT